MTHHGHNAHVLGLAKPICLLLTLGLLLNAGVHAESGEEVLQVFSNPKAIAEKIADRVNTIETSVDKLEAEAKNLRPEEVKQKAKKQKAKAQPANTVKKSLATLLNQISAAGTELSLYNGIKSADSGFTPKEQETFREIAKLLPEQAKKASEALAKDQHDELRVQIKALKKTVADGKFTWLKKPSDTPAAGPYLVGPPITVGPFETTRFPNANVYYSGNKAIKSTLDLSITTAFYPRNASFSFGPNGEPFPKVWGRAYVPYVVKRSLDPEEGEDPKEDPKAARAKRNAEVKEIFAKRGLPKEDIDDVDVVGDSFVPQVRWHLYCQKAGEIKMAFYLAVTAEEAKVPWVVQVAQGPQVDEVQSGQQKKESKQIGLVESDGQKAQPQVLTIQVKKPGRVSIYLNQDAMPKAAGKLFFIRCTGAAMENALLLNTKTSPWSLYATFLAPKECPQPLFWVMETKVVGGNVAFCPAVTPFGYFGKLFYGNYIEPDASRLHWSMWTKKKGIPRIVASGNPELKGSINSNEGTTVRGVWNVCSSPERSVVQAFRATTGAPDRSTTYFGYVYDSAEKKWKLYVAGQQGFPRKAVDDQPAFEEKTTDGHFGFIKTFVEVITRKVPSGDCPRRIYRRAWFYGSDGKFYPARLPREGDIAKVDPEKGEDVEKDKPATINASNHTALRTWNYETEGWVECLTGGVALYKAKPSAHTAADLSKRVAPEYLKSEHVKEILAIPVTFGGKRATEITDTTATVEYQITATGSNSKGILYYGEKDSNAHIRPKPATEPKPATQPPEPKKNTKFSNDGTRAAAKAIEESGWGLSTKEQAVQTGKNDFKIANLKPDTTYFYRVRITNDNGMSWDYISGYFKTQKTKD